MQPGAVAAASSAISASGSTAPVSTVPAEAMTSHGRMPLRRSSLERLRQRVGAHPVASSVAISRRGDASAPGDAQRLVDAMMGEAGHIDGAAAIRVARLAGGDDRGEVGDAAARGQRAGGVLRNSR